MTAQLALPIEPRRRGPAEWYRHAPGCWLELGERKGRFAVMGHAHRWWEFWQQLLIRRFLAQEHELGERVAAVLR